jgi:hypothetical protein
MLVDWSKLRNRAFSFNLFTAGCFQQVVETGLSTKFGLKFLQRVESTGDCVLENPTNIFSLSAQLFVLEDFSILKFFHQR